MSSIKLTNNKKKIKIQAIKNNISKTEKINNEKDRKLPDRSPILLILYLIGILGIMNSLNTAINIDNAYFFIAETAVVLLSTFLWYMYIYYNKYFNYIVLPLTLLSVVLVFINSVTTSQSLLFLSMDSITELSPFLLGVLIYMSVLLVFTLEFVSRNHSIMFIICTILFILGPTVGISFTPITSVMILIFQFGFIALNMNSASPRKTMKTEKHSKTGFISTAITACLLILCFFPALIIENVYESDIISNVNYVDGIIHDIVNYFTNNDESGILDGTVNKGNLRQTGEQLFEADVVKKPEDRLYLKAFTGNNYNGEKWDNAFVYFSQNTEPYITDSYTLYSPSYYPDFDENYDFYYFRSNRRHNYYREPFINDILQKSVQAFFDDLNRILREHGVNEEIQYVTLSDSGILAYGTNKLWARILYNEGSIEYQIKNENIDKFYINAEELPNYPSLLITNSSDPVNNIYSDGVTENISDNENINRICISPYQNKFINILLPYYSEKNINDIRQSFSTISFTYSTTFGNTDNTAKLYADTKWSGKQSYEHFIDSYISQIKDTYTNVPYKSMPKLTQLCNSTDLTEINDITTFILYTLQTNANYSTTPGSVPYNKNTIEYFLFENHKGYCVHFATTAALMYRMFGIPARYVTGYAIDSDNFKEIENTSEKSDVYKYKAQITDYSAHAWVEIFLKDYGWVPVEVTPTKDGKMIAEYPGYDQNEMNRIMKKYDWHFDNDEEVSTNNNTADEDEELTPGTICLIVTLCLVCATLIFIPLRRMFILQRQSSMNCRQLFDRLIKALHFFGIPTNLNGSEKNFAEILTNTVPIISSDDSAYLINILQSDNYSETYATDIETDFVRNIYVKSADYLYKHLKWYKKPIFKFIKCLN